jgi:hypothetical protein
LTSVFCYRDGLFLIKGINNASFDIKNTNPDHGMTTEQIKPFLTRLIDGGSNPLIHTMVLLLRCRIEAEKTKTIERALMQLQNLVDQFDDASRDLAKWSRWFWQVPVPSRWEMLKEFAERMVSIGLLKSAIQVFERLKMWEDVISLYQMMDDEVKVCQARPDDIYRRRNDCCWSSLK